MYTFFIKASNVALYRYLLSHDEYKDGCKDNIWTPL